MTFLGKSIPLFILLRRKHELLSQTHEQKLILKSPTRHRQGHTRNTLFDLLFYISKHKKNKRSLHNHQISLTFEFFFRKVQWNRKRKEKNVNIYPITVVIFFIFWFPFHIHDVPGSVPFCVRVRSNDKMILAVFDSSSPLVIFMLSNDDVPFLFVACFYSCNFSFDKFQHNNQFSCIFPLFFSSL